MTAPTIGTAAQTAWDALPAYVRDADATLDWPLARYLGGIVGQAQTAVTLVEQGAALGLIDECPPEWVEWVGALAGIPIPSTVIGQDARRAWVTDETAQRRGTLARIVTAVQATLTGGKSVFMVPYYTGDANQIYLQTITAETPSTPTTLAAARAEVPAWIKITLSVVSGTTWQQIVTASRAWSVVDDRTWGAVQTWTP